MKKHAVFLTALLFFGLSATSALGADKLQVHVPFSFYVENTLLPAGDYVVSTVDPFFESTLMIRSVDGGTGVQFLTESVEKMQPANRSELVFDVASGQHYLSQVWEVGREYGWELQPSSIRRHAMASSNNTSKQSLNCTNVHGS